MGLFDNFDNLGGIFGGVAGGLAGLPAGIPGTLLAGWGGSKIGQGLQNKFMGGNNGSGDYNGMPGGLNYLSMEPDQLNVNPNYDKSGLNAFQAEAMRTGPSQGSLLAMHQNDQDTLAARANAKAGAQGAAAMARSQLAMHGGLGGGAAERVGKSAADSAVNAAQNAESMGAKNRSMIGMEDDKNRLGALAQLPGMQLGAAQFDYGTKADNVNRLTQEQTRRNMYNSNIYNQNMAAWGAGKQADATAKSGKK